MFLYTQNEPRPKSFQYKKESKTSTNYNTQHKHWEWASENDRATVYVFPFIPYLYNSVAITDNGLCILPCILEEPDKKSNIIKHEETEMDGWSGREKE